MLTSAIIGVSTVSASSGETGNINQPALYTVQDQRILSIYQKEVTQWDVSTTTSETSGNSKR